MAVKFIYPKPEDMAVGVLIADRRLWLTKDKQRLVEDGDVEAAFLFCARGRPIPEADCERFGLRMDGGGKLQVGGKQVKPAPIAETVAPEPSPPPPEDGPPEGVNEVERPPKKRGRPRKS